MTPVSAMHLAVVIPTRNRPDDVRRCLASLAAVRYADWEVLLVDQSTDDQTGAIARQFASQLPQLTYWHLDQPGVARARNLGVGRTRGELIVFLDDDCTVEPDWLDRVAATASRYPTAAIIFGTVTAAPHDWRTTFIPDITWEREWVVGGRRALPHWRGLGASMAVRRDLFERVGGFDLHFGPGSGYFESAEEAEFMARATRRGAAVLRTPAISVLHHGARAYADGAYRRLLRHSLRSRGAVDFNLVWSGEPLALPIALLHLWETIRIVRPLNLLTHRGPTHLSWPVFYLQGFATNLWLHLRHRASLTRA